MSVLWTIALTFALLLVVAIPIAGLAGRGRKRLAGLAETPALAPATGLRKLDPSLQSIDARTRALLDHAASLEALHPAYLEALPLLEVMAAARSSPRVYPSQWVGETNDAYRAALMGLTREAIAWREAWATLPARVRAELRREGAEALLDWCEGASEGGVLMPTFREASTFSYLGPESLEGIHVACRGLMGPVEAFLRALSESSSNPYR